MSISELDAHTERQQQLAAAAGPGNESIGASDAQPPEPASVGDPEDVEESEEDPRIRSLTELAVDRVLAAQAAAWTDPQLISQVDATIENAATGVLLQAMIERRGWNDPELSTEELKAYFEAHPEFYDEPRRARLQHIFLRAEKGVLPAAERQEIQQRLEALRQEALNGADFSALARQNSESATAASGGFMSLEATTPVPETFSAAVWSLKVNEISEVVDAGNGFHLIKLTQLFEPSRRTFEESLDHIRRKAGQAKVLDLMEQLIQDVGPRYGLERHYDRVHSDPEAEESAVLISLGNGDTYTLSDLLLELHDALQEQLYQGYMRDVHRVLDQVAANRLLVLEARDQKLEEDPEIARQIAEAAEQIRAEAALQRRLDQAVAAVSESEMREYFDQNKDRYQTLRTYDLTVIHLEPEKGESYWQVLKRGEKLVARIRAGEDMEALAREHSRHYSAVNGGRMYYLTEVGLRTRVQATVKFRRRLEALEPGGVTDPFLSECYDPPRLTYIRTGVFIVRLDALHEPVRKGYDEMAEAVRQNYLRRHHQRLAEEVRQQVAEEIGLEIFADRLPAS